jgi:hypothetical protein
MLPCDLPSQSLRSRESLGGEAVVAGAKKSKKQREHILPPVSCTKVHLSWCGLCATWLGTYLHGTEETKKPEAKNLPLLLQCEPLGSHKEGDCLPASLPVRAGHIRSQAKWACLTTWQAEMTAGRQGAICEASSRYHGPAFDVFELPHSSPEYWDD